MGFFREFKAFALRGNVIDLAVGVIIGGAFGKITNSLVNHVLMPPLGVVAKTDFRSFYHPLFSQADAAAKNLPPNYTLEDVKKADLPAIQYGEFLTTVLDFFILALCVFVMVKLMNVAMRRLLQDEKTAEQAAKAPELSLSEKLLMEIRDELKARRA
jgi:large conductance mechanosensitive channel